MQLKTRVFELSNGKYRNLSGLAQAMGISVPHIYRVRQGRCGINRKFIVGAVKAFPQYKLDDLFYVVPEGERKESSLSLMSSRADKVIKLREADLSYAEIGRRLGMTREWARQIVRGKPSRQKPPLRSRVMLTASDVAQLLGLHPNTVRRWNEKGILKSYRIGSRGDRRFRRKDIDGFLNQGEM